MGRARRIGIRAKILALISGIIVLVLGAISYIYVKNVQGEYVHGMVERAQVLTTGMAKHIRTLSLSSNNVEWILKVQSVNAVQLFDLEKDKGVLYVGVLDQSGRYLAHNEVAARDKRETQADLLRALAARTPSTIFVRGTYHGLVPVFDDQNLYLGTIIVGFDGAALDARIVSLLKQSVVVSLLFMFMGIGAIYSMLNALLIKPMMALQLATGEIARGHLEVQVTADGKDEVGQLASGIAHMRDAIRAQISALQTYQDGLESLVTKRTAELQTALSLAESASAAKGQFLANMSHELRTPMNAILGLLQLLQRTALSSHQLDYATKAGSAARSLLGILNDILDFSKVEAGKMTLDPQPFRVDKLLSDLSVILSASMGEKNIEILFAVDPAVPEALVGDSMRLQQVLINLSGNAVKFTEQGEVVVSVAMEEPGESDALITFAVRDTGIGISPENQQRIFEGFSQAEASTTRRFGGTGLGLTISQRFVELMGGELTLESKIGAGSTFRFSLRMPLGEKAERAPGPLDKPLHALIVAGNAMAREMLSSMGRSIGWTVDTAGSGEEARALLEAQAEAKLPYQAIFVDWKLPGMAADGWETCERLCELRQTSGTLLMLIVTAHGREILGRRLDDRPGLLDGFLVKPVTASMLSDAIAQASAGRQAQKHLTIEPPVRNQARLSGLRLLVVEDNLTNQQVAHEMLSAEGALVTIAENGRLGVASVATASPPFDAVLMDLQMPEMDGFTATREIRQKLRMTALPIIAMTANALPADRAACLDAGMDDHAGKPFDLSQLVATLLHHIGKASSRSTSQAERPPGKLIARLPETINPGIDERGALVRLGGNVEVYLRMIRSFQLELPDMVSGLEAHLLQERRQDTMRLLHTLKGVASTVGATGLSTAAANAERTLQNPIDGLATEALFAGLRGTVETTMAALQEIAPRLAAAAPGQEPPALNLSNASSASSASNTSNTSNAMTDPVALRQALEALGRLLSSANLQALDVYTKLRQDHGAALQEQLQAMDSAMTRLDFKLAHRCCQKLIEGIQARA